MLFGHFNSFIPNEWFYAHPIKLGGTGEVEMPMLEPRLCSLSFVTLGFIIDPWLPH